MNPSSVLGRSVTGFVAAWAAARAAGVIPAAVPVWSMAGVPPFGVPRAVNLAFWGGIWGAVLAQVFAGMRGAGYWLAWTLAGAIAVTAVAIFVVPAIKGLAIANLTPQRFIIGGLLNGAFGLGAAVWLRLLRRMGSS